MQQTLLTGFGPFGNVVSNPTERLIQRFATETVPGHRLTFCALPVSFARADALLQSALTAGGENGRPFENVLMLGVAAGSSRWRVERLGRNRDDPRLPDADGFSSPHRAILPDGPKTLASTFPVETILAALHAGGIPAVLSEDAGSYLCNHVLFTTLEWLRRTGSTARAGFLHVPADEQTFADGQILSPYFPFEQHIEAIRLTLAALA